jgi:hypothetical protein
MSPPALDASRQERTRARHDFTRYALLIDAIATTVSAGQHSALRVGVDP